MKLYVGNLPFSADEEVLKNLFAAYSPDEISLIKDKFSGRSKGFGFVTISNEETAKKAISEMNEKEIEGRKLTVNEARPIDPDRPRRSSFGGDRPRSGGFGGGRSDRPRSNFGGRSDRPPRRY